MTLTPTKYAVQGHTFKRHDVYIERRTQRDGSWKWVCSTGDGTALNDEGHFELEPLPSNRSDEYIARTRFDSAEAALANFEKHMPNFGPIW